MAMVRKTTMIRRAVLPVSLMVLILITGGSLASPAGALAPLSSGTTPLPDAIAAVRAADDLHRQSVEVIDASTYNLQYRALNLSARSWVNSIPTDLLEVQDDLEDASTAVGVEDAADLVDVRRRLEHMRHRSQAVDDLRTEAYRDLAHTITALAGVEADVYLTHQLLTADSATIDALLTAMEFLGTRYVRGANGPYAFDCSGFTKFIYEPYVDLPHRAAYQYDLLGSSPNYYPQPGDLLFYDGGPTAAGPLSIGHVAVYVGAGVIIHSASSELGVAFGSMNTSRDPVALSTPIGSMETQR